MHTYSALLRGIKSNPNIIKITMDISSNEVVQQLPSMLIYSHTTIDWQW